MYSDNRIPQINIKDRTYFEANGHQYFFVMKNPHEVFPVTRRFEKHPDKYVKNEVSFHLALPSRTIFDDLLLNGRTTTFNILTIPTHKWEVKTFPSLPEFLPPGRHNYILYEDAGILFQGQFAFFENCFGFLKRVKYENEYELYTHNVFLTYVYSSMVLNLYQDGTEENRNLAHILDLKPEELDNYVRDSLDDRVLRGLFRSQSDDDKLYEQCKTKLLGNIVEHYPSVLGGYF